MEKSLLPLSLKAGVAPAGVAPPQGMAKPAVAQRPQGLSERSVFHEPWWLDITAGGSWDSAIVKDGDEVVAEMPYMLHRKGPWLLSTQPPLTRTLGPIIKPPKVQSEQDWRYQIQLTAELISKLPRCVLFEQTLDTRIGEAIAFALHDFSISTSFTLTVPPHRTEQDVWQQMRPNTRNLIRRAEERVMVSEIVSAAEFVDFYDVNLAERNRRNVYGSQLMRRLVGEVIRRKAGIVLGAFSDARTLSAAVTLVWDNSTLYYLLSTRSARAHSGCVALLLWRALQLARERNLTFDFDGIPNMQILTFLSGFGGTPAQRLTVERSRFDYATVRAIRRFATRGR
ncbi:hypothetical protein P3T18_001529 [Paraburkholderia sp. GAS199]|uniref:GNAT family N-acetyltransferase n=1 Tax=Paraburkholderia sp. GAS199 TaxID=3035126 RepID=UPI003D195BEF